MEGKTKSFAGKISVVEAEAIRVHEVLSWINSKQLQNVIIESDFLLTVKGLHEETVNEFELGHILTREDILFR